MRLANRFSIEMLRVGGQLLRAGRSTASGGGLPLLLFNGIGGNIELLEPLAQQMPERELITFDVPGVGHSQLPRRPYRLDWIVRLACSVLDHYGHRRCDVLGVSWGGAVAQQFARRQQERCRRLILCATGPGVVMWPGSPSVACKMATPRRFMSRAYARRVAGDLYGGDFRRDPDLAARLFEHIRWQTRLGYYFQVLAVAAWTSVHWLRRLPQPTLIMAGADDPLVPLPNARLMRRLIPCSELKVFDCGHLFLLTRAEESARAIREFLDRGSVPLEASAPLLHEERTMDTEKLIPADLAARAGQELGVSSWITIDQARIDAFAACTGDHQWIHVDVERARRESPFGETVAHGYLTLSLLGPTGLEVLMGRVGARQALNYGLDKVRFLAPVRAGRRVRNRMRLAAVEDKGGGRLLLTTENTIEIEGEAKPALVATTLALLME